MDTSANVLYVYHCDSCDYHGSARFADDNHDDAAHICDHCGATVSLEWDGGVSLRGADSDDVAPRAYAAMMPGTIRSPEQGRQYRVRHSDGQLQEYVFEGFGEYMKPLWRSTDSGEVFTDLPPYTEHEKL